MLFTDIEGSTRLLQQLGDGYGELLAEHRRILRDAVAAHGGREMDTQGDAFFFAFARARNAVGAAIDAQRGLAAHEWPDGVQCRVRMGLHTGEPSVLEEGYHGLGLHRGARIAASALGGQVLLSRATAELVQDELPGGATLRDLGDRRLKDIARPERVFELVLPGLPAAPRGAPRRKRAVVGAAVALVAAGAAAGVLLGTHGGSGHATAVAVSSNAVGMIRGGNGHLVGQIGVGSSPSAVTAGDGSVWVANVDDHSVSRIDPAKQAVVQTIQVGNGPAGIAYGDGFVWVTNGLDGTVSQINPDTNTVVDTIQVGNGPAGVAVAGNRVWVANANDGAVSRIAVLTGKVRDVTSVGAGANGVAVGDGSVWVTSESTGSVTRIDLGSDSVVQSIQTGTAASAVIVALGGVWVANDLDGTVTRLDPATNTVRATIAVGDGPNGLGISGGSVWVSNELAGTISKIDAARNVVVGTVRTGNAPEGLVADAGTLFVAVRGSGVGHRGGTLAVRGGAGFYGLDPALNVGYENALTNDGLTGFRRVGGSAGTRIVPDLAVSLPLPTSGGRSYTFRLRPGIRYSTGEPVETEDFRRGLERTLVLNPSYGGSYYARVVGAPACLAQPKKPCDLAAGIVVNDRARTVTYNLSAPDPDFLAELALPPAYPVPADTPLHVRRPIPATGPYMVASYSKTALRLVRNPEFHEWSRAAQPAGFPDEIVEHIVVGSAQTEFDLVEHGKADLVAHFTGRPSGTVLATARTRYAGQLQLNPRAITFFIALNTKVPPFDDLRARQAVALAIDRQRLASLAFGVGLAHVTCQILPPNFDGYRPYCPYTRDLARARKLVRESHTAGDTVLFWIPHYTGIGTGAGKYVVSVLDSLGYKARFVFVDDYSQEGKLRPQAGFNGWLPDFATPAGFIDQALTCESDQPANPGNQNVAEFCDPAIDRDIARAQSLQATDPEAATNLWSKVDRELTDQAPWVPFGNSLEVGLTSLRVGNYQYNPQWGILLDQLWVR
jgi:YVTN family beta-propeller protein